MHTSGVQRFRRHSVRYAAALIACVCFSGCVSVSPVHRDAGPLYAVDRDLQGIPRERGLGPLLERQQSDDGQTFAAVRPFWSRTHDPESDRTVTDILWPIAMFKTRQGELDWRVFPAYGHDYDMGDPVSRYRWSVFPVLFGGRDRDGQRYFSVFPLGGTLNEFLGRDRIVFVLFPLYTFSTINELRTHSVLWPVYSRTTGSDVHRFRVWPFYGVSIKEDRWRKRFVMWPLWTSVQYHEPDQQGGGFVLFPIYGRVDVNGRHSRMVIPPLFKVEWTDDGAHRALSAPWPFIQYRKGDTDQLYLWPLYGKRSSGFNRQGFAVWPVVSWRVHERKQTSARQFRMLPVFYYESIRKQQTAGEEGLLAAKDEPVRSRYVKVWPLVSYRREQDHSLLRMLALWPLKHTPAIERNWAPLWSLYRRERAGEERLTEALWGLVRHRSGDVDRTLSVFPVLQVKSDAHQETRSWSVLYGLAGYRREGDRKTARLLYFLRMGWGGSHEDEELTREDMDRHDN